MFDIEFNGITFNGFRFKRTKPYSEEYMNDLIKDGSHYSKMKYKNIVENLIMQNLHIALSFSIISEILSLAFLVISIIFILKILIVSAISFCLSIVFIIIFTLLKNRANEFYIGKKISKELINLIFDDK
jgi:hypothetical protein